MATKLSETTNQVKKFLIFFGGFIVLVFFIDMLAGGTLLKPASTGEVIESGYPEANDLFQQIPAPQLKSLPTDASSKAIIAKTSTNFPKLPPVVYVYKIKPEREYLSDAADARKAALELDFKEVESRVVNNVMYWETLDRNRTFSYDKAQRLFTYKYSKLPALDPAKLKGTSADYLSIASSYLGSLQVFDNSLRDQAGIAEFISISSEGFQNNSATKPNAARVSIFRNIVAIEPSDNKKTTTTAWVRKPKYTDGVANFVIAGDGKEIATSLISYSFKNYIYDYSAQGIYRILSPEQAFTKIQEGKGILYRLALYGENELSGSESLAIAEFKLDTLNAKIIYLEPDNRQDSVPWTNFLQPFIMFDGIFTTTDGRQGNVSYIVPALIDSNYK